jgi:UDP-N-acetylmuramoyl-L-alanyl-D-glutamate--2,6-diaminopimelate ligase
VDFKKTLIIEDRKEAIKTAAIMAKKGDIILIAGKGHETYQEIKGVKYPFDDREVVKEILNLLNKN